jgi:hypothetical protein
MTDTIDTTRRAGDFDPAAFIDDVEWRPSTSPEYDRDGLRHEYTAFAGSMEDPAADDHKAFVAHVRKHGYRRRFGRNTYTYLNVGAHRYWAFWRVINRCPADATWDDPREAAS